MGNKEPDVAQAAKKEKDDFLKRRRDDWSRRTREAKDRTNENRRLRTKRLEEDLLSKDPNVLQKAEKMRNDRLKQKRKSYRRTRDARKEASGAGSP